MKTYIKYGIVAVLSIIATDVYKVADSILTDED